MGDTALWASNGKRGMKVENEKKQRSQKTRRPKGLKLIQSTLKERQTSQMNTVCRSMAENDTANQGDGFTMEMV